MNILIPLAFLAILGSLGTALFFMLRGSSEETADADAKRKGMARALAIRIGVSVVVFMCVLLAWKLGYIQPTGIRPGQ
jgi:flagellar basal body-associated protein FliL